MTSAKSICRLAAVLFGALLPATAQSVSPVIAESRGGAMSGSFDVTNDTLQMLVVTIEPKSFTIDREGKGQFRALDAGIHVSFSETSLRLPPKSRRTVLYRASAEAYPAWFSVYAMFRGLPKQNGMNVQLELPHTVYLLGDAKRAKPQHSDLTFAELAVRDGEVHGLVRNTSPRMVRVASLDAFGLKRTKTESGGFPLLPGGEREFAVKAPAGVERVEARFGDGVVLATPIAP